MPPTPVAVLADDDRAHVEPGPHQPLANDQPPPQQCGRCRQLFEGDPTLYPPAQPDWWLCPPCRAILLGRSPRPHHVAQRQKVGDTS
jgi:hypothetical protein